MSRKKIKLVASEIKDMCVKNTEYIVDEIKVYDSRHVMNEFKLYAYLSNMFDKTLILDIGTYWGKSALALAHNPLNVVTTFDIKDYIEDSDHIIYTMDNMYFKIGDFLDYEDMIMDSSILMIDITHNGEDEMRILKKLYYMKYMGLLLFDDIVAFEKMRVFWNTVQYKKHDITSVGHWSGTGIIDMFNKFDVEVINDI